MPLYPNASHRKPPHPRSTLGRLYSAPAHPHLNPAFHSMAPPSASALVPLYPPLLLHHRHHHHHLDATHPPSPPLLLVYFHTPASPLAPLHPPAAIHSPALHPYLNWSTRVTNYTCIFILYVF